MKITRVGAVRSPDPTEIVTLLIDDEDSAYVYGLYRSAEAAESALQVHLVERFGQETVEEAESDEDQGLAGLLSYTIGVFRNSAIVDMINADCVADLREQHGGIWGEHPDYPRCDWRLEVANGDTSQGYWVWVLSALELAADESGGPSTPRLKLKVENAYSDGYTSELTRRMKLDRYVDEEALWEDLFCYTGDGHGIDRDVDLFCTITILESPDRPELEGLTNDFG
ncbi:hypothetical protein [Mycobacteroides salmoniphilum]|uniref:Uncharacterized protein n=1 Tax=Mycobacteroides salmoniphilum TaxID=404941 RepID=A0A4R8SZM7_9MYCO|nr:hypothetical protein [Mycobacteroides salmoniphilum]TEA09065.1 hypothetical protein CCUG60884_00233 [Mycobacteroides salmoniphilum]